MGSWRRYLCKAAYSDNFIPLQMKAFLLIPVVSIITSSTSPHLHQEASRTGSLVETRDGQTFLVEYKSPTERGIEEDVDGESSHRLTKVKASKSTKSAKERHYQVLAEILKFYKNPNPKWRMITDDKDQRDKLKSFAPKMKFGAKDLKKLKSVKDGRPSICERCKKCPTMCEL